MNDQPTSPPRIILCRDTSTMETAALVASFNSEYQCFGPLPSCKFPGAYIIVAREGEEQIQFMLYEVEIARRPEGTKGFRPGKARDLGKVTAYVWARDYENFCSFCERVLKIDVLGKPEEN